MLRTIEKIEVTVKRPSGEIETVDATHVGAMNAAIVKQMRQATKDGGRGYVMKAVVTYVENNVRELAKRWNDVNNEGGYGAMPAEGTFRNSPEYREWTERETFH